MMAGIRVPAWLASVALLLVPVVALAGCGSTVPLARIGGGGGLAIPADTAAALSPPSASPTVAGAPSGGGPAASLSALGAAAQPTGSAGPSAAANGAPGRARPAALASRAPVQVGIVYVDSAAAESAAGALGYSLNPGDPYAEAQALVAWMNEQGGLAGHPVQPLYLQYPVGGNADTFEQSACQDWTRDHHAVAVIYPTNFSPDAVLSTCLARAGVMLTGGADSFLNESGLAAAHGYLVTPYMFAGDRMSPLLVDELVDRHWFAPGSRIGLISVDGSAYSADAKLIAARLAHYGLTVTDQATVANGSQQDAQDCQSAALRFAADHITNVVVVDDGAVVMIYCSPVFRTQSYFPKFSITSYDSPSTVATLIPATSLQGSAGIGWEPVNDVSAPTINSAGSLCLQIMQAAGQDVTASALEESLAMAYCDGFFFFHQAYRTAGSLAANRVQQAIAGLGAGYTSPIAISDRFAPGRFDGVASVEYLAYETGCGCYRYQGGQVPTG